MSGSRTGHLDHEVLPEQRIGLREAVGRTHGRSLSRSSSPCLLLPAALGMGLWEQACEV